MNSFPTFFSKLLKNSTAFALVAVSSISGTFAMQGGEGVVREAKTSPSRKLPTPSVKIPFTLQDTNGSGRAKGNAEKIDDKSDIGGPIKVTTKEDNASYELESEQFSVTPGEKIRVPYEITVEAGGKMSLGLLRTDTKGWYGKELFLEAGQHTGVFERIVPVGETKASLVLRNAHLKIPGQTIFTIDKIDIFKEDTSIRPIERKSAIVIEEKAEAIQVDLQPTGGTRTGRAVGKAEKIEKEGRKITVTTDNNKAASYQLESEKFDVTPGETIRVPYDITVEAGGRMSLGLLRTDTKGWYGKELFLEAGPHKGVFERIVPVGETKASLVLRNAHLQQPGQTIFTIDNIKILKEEAGAPVLSPPNISSSPKIESPSNISNALPTPDTNLEEPMKKATRKAPGLRRPATAAELNKPKSWKNQKETIKSSEKETIKSSEIIEDPSVSEAAENAQQKIKTPPKAMPAMSGDLFKALSEAISKSREKLGENPEDSWQPSVDTLKKSPTIIEEPIIEKPKVNTAIFEERFQKFNSQIQGIDSQVLGLKILIDEKEREKAQIEPEANQLAMKSKSLSKSDLQEANQFNTAIKEAKEKVVAANSDISKRTNEIRELETKKAELQRLQSEAEIRKAAVEQKVDSDKELALLEEGILDERENMKETQEIIKKISSLASTKIIKGTSAEKIAEINSAKEEMEKQSKIGYESAQKLGNIRKQKEEIETNIRKQKEAAEDKKRKEERAKEVQLQMKKKAQEGVEKGSLADTLLASPQLKRQREKEEAMIQSEVNRKREEAEKQKRLEEIKLKEEAEQKEKALGDEDEWA